MTGKDDDIPEYLRGIDQAPDRDERFAAQAEQRADAEPAPRPVDEEHDDYDDDDDFTQQPRRSKVSPLLVLLVIGVLSVLCLGVTGSVTVGGTMVGSAEATARTEASQFTSIALLEEDVIDGIGSKGGDRKRLRTLYDAVSSAQGYRSGLAAKLFAEEVQLEMTHVGDARGTSLDASRETLSFALREFTEADAAWRSSASGLFGGMAVAIGMANAPPD